jgi:hypothetical protein
LKSAPQLRSAINIELGIAKARWGEGDFELNCLEGSRGELMADALLLQRLRYFNQHGAGYAQVLEQVPALGLWHRVGLPVRNAFSKILTPSRRGEREMRSLIPRDRTTRYPKAQIFNSTQKDAGRFERQPQST